MEIKSILNELNLLAQKKDRINALKSISKLKELIEKEKQTFLSKFLGEILALSPIKFLEKYVQDTYPVFVSEMFTCLNQMLDNLSQMHQKISSNNFNIQELLEDLETKNQEYERKFLILDTYFKLFELFGLAHFYYKGNKQLIDHFIFNKKKSFMFDKFDSFSYNDLQKVREKINLEIDHYSKKLNVKLS